MLWCCQEQTTTSLSLPRKEKPLKRSTQREYEISTAHYSLASRQKKLNHFLSEKEQINNNVS